jgi:hypothetical protein
MKPLLAVEWPFAWLACGFSRWSFLEVLEYLGNFSVLIRSDLLLSESLATASAEALPDMAGYQHCGSTWAAAEAASKL